MPSERRAKEAGYDERQKNRLCATGHIWATEFAGVCESRQAKFGGTLIAASREEANAEAERRGLGETVLGPIHSVIPAGPNTAWNLGRQ